MNNLFTLTTLTQVIHFKVKVNTFLHNILKGSIGGIWLKERLNS
jgi:hypothetical protein